MSNRKILFSIIIVLFCILVITRAGDIGVNDNYLVKNGVLKLNRAILSVEDIIALNGEWEYYPGELLSLTEVMERDQPTYITVPGPFNDFKTPNQPSKRFGYATLHMKIEGASTRQIYGLKTSVIRLAHSIYINNLLVSNAGKPAKDIKNYVPDNTPYTVYFSNDSDNINIIIHLANYEYATGGGIAKPIYFGNQQAISKLTNKLLAIDWIRIASFFVMALFFIGIYTLNKINLKIDQPALFYFSLYCLAYGLYVATQSQKVFMLVFSSLDYYTYSLIQRSVIPFAVYSQISYVYYALGANTKRTFINILTVLSVGLVIIITILPVRVHTYFADIYAACLTMPALIYTLIIIIKAIREGRDGSLFLLLSGTGIMCYAINETIAVFSNSYSNLRTPYEPLFFIATQAFFQAKDYLNYHANLIKMENGYLAAQIKPHFLYNSLNTVVALSYLDLEKSRELVGTIAEFLRGRLNYKTENHQIPLTQELDMVKAYLEIEKIRFGDRLTIKYDIEDYDEYYIPPMIVQTLVENALKHGLESKDKGVLKIIGIPKEYYYEITIEDNGVGMSNDKIKAITKLNKSSGLGIKNVNKRLALLRYEPLEIKSEVDSGTKIIIKLKKK